MRQALGTGPAWGHPFLSLAPSIPFSFMEQPRAKSSQLISSKSVLCCVSASAIQTQIFMTSQMDFCCGFLMGCFLSPF